MDMRGVIKHIGLRPVVPIGFWNEVSGVWERRLAVGKIPANVVWVQVGRDHKIDSLSINALLSHVC